MIILSLFWIALNLPDGQSLKPFPRWAGFPLPFALWEGRKLEWFDLSALIEDIIIGVVVVLGIATICAWSHRKTMQDN